MDSEKEASNHYARGNLSLGSRHPLRRDAVALIFIAACWMAAIILVNPIGEFPSVDDWSYLLAVRALVESGEIRFSDWTGANLLSHVAWGSLFALPLGVSYTTLHISTWGRSKGQPLLVFRAKGLGPN